MTETPSGSWPTGADERNVPVENDASRPSTMETYTTSEETRGPECEENDGHGLWGLRHSSGKQSISRMPELPPEIRERYVFSIIGITAGRFRLPTRMMIDAIPLQNTLPYRPRNLRLTRSGRSSLARGIANAPSLRTSSLKMSIFLSVT